MEKNESKKSTLAFIKNNKVPVAVPIILIALCTGFSGFHSARGILALLSYGGAASLNDVFAFLLAAVTGLLEYEFITFFVCRMSVVRLGKTAIDLRRDLRWFFAAGYLMSGLTKLLYFAFPFLISYGEIFFDFIWCAAAFSAFIVYACKNYYEPEQYSKVTMYLGSAFLVLYGLIAALSFVSGVVA